MSAEWTTCTHGSMQIIRHTFPESKIHGANMGPICGRQDPGGPHVGPMNFVIWVYMGRWSYDLGEWLYPAALRDCIYLPIT